MRECSCYGEREKKQKMAKKCKFIQEESRGVRVRRNRQERQKMMSADFFASAATADQSRRRRRGKKVWK